jgi:hypothetical protein
VVTGDAKREFSAETDITWDDFQRRVLVYLENTNQTVQLACKLSSEPGKASHLANINDFNAVIARLRQTASSARTKAVGLEVKNIVSICLQITNCKPT